MSTQHGDAARGAGNMPPTLMPAEGQEPLIAIRGLKVHYDLGGGTAWDKMVGGSKVRRVV